MKYKRIIRLLSCLLLTLFTTFGLEGQNRYVSDTGSDVGNDCSIAGLPCGTINHAIDMAQAGDTIFIGAGIYTESVYINKELHLVGEGPESTIVQAHSIADSARDRVIYVDKYYEDSLSVSIEGLTVRNGRATGYFPDNRGGGIYNKVDLFLKNVKIVNNYADAYGGGLCDVGSTRLVDVQFINNKAGILGGGMFGDYWAKTFRNCQFINNSCGSHGGGLFLYNIDSVQMESTTFRENQSKENGGGAYFKRSKVNARDINFYSNHAFSRGGGIFYEGPYLNIQGSIFKNNRADFDFVAGGGLFFAGDVLFMDTFLIQGNIASSGYGGGVVIKTRKNTVLTHGKVLENESKFAGGGLHYGALIGEANLRINDVIFKNNHTSLEGGGLWLSSMYPSASMLITNSIISYNTAGSGGGICLPPRNDDTLIVINTLFEGNEGVEGGAIHSDFVSRHVLINNTFVNNKAILGGQNSKRKGGALFFENPINPEIINCIFYGNTSEEMGNDIYCKYIGTRHEGNLYISYSNISTDPEDIYTEDGTITIGEGVVNYDPHFRSADDFSLADDSPLINAGDPDTDLSIFPVDKNGIAIDIVGNPRIINDTIDMGAYENQAAGRLLTELIKSPRQAEKLVCVPNPAVNYTFIKLPSWTLQRDIQVAVINAAGEKVLSRSVKVSDKYLRIRTTELQTGMYYLKVHNQSKTASGKFLVMR